MIVEPGDTPESLATPFETWCDSVGLHPEALGAWELYERSIATGIVAS